MTEREKAFVIATYVGASSWKPVEVLKRVLAMAGAANVSIEIVNEVTLEMHAFLRSLGE